MFVSNTDRWYEGFHETKIMFVKHTHNKQIVFTDVLSF